MINEFLGEGGIGQARTSQDHTPLSLFHLLSRTICHRSPLSASPPGPFPPSLLLLKAIEDREHLTLENIPYFTEFGEGGRKTWYFPLAVSRDLIYKTAFETNPHPVYFLCQPVLSLKWGCSWSAQWSACFCELKPKRYVRKGLVSWRAGLLVEKDDFRYYFTEESWG